MNGNCLQVIIADHSVFMSTYFLGALFVSSSYMLFFTFAISMKHCLENVYKFFMSDEEEIIAVKR